METERETGGREKFEIEHSLKPPLPKVCDGNTKTNLWQVINQNMPKSVNVCVNI